LLLFLAAQNEKGKDCIGRYRISAHGDDINKEPTEGLMNQLQSTQGKTVLKKFGLLQYKRVPGSIKKIKGLNIHSFFYLFKNLFFTLVYQLKELQSLHYYNRLHKVYVVVILHYANNN
jgi:hypothetical protein